MERLSDAISSITFRNCTKISSMLNASTPVVTLRATTALIKPTRCRTSAMQLQYVVISGLTDITRSRMTLSRTSARVSYIQATIEGKFGLRRAASKSR